MNPALTFGIAGHVDHGKTSLVRALTGVETDRLSEEIRRGISIELGFAHMVVPDAGGNDISIGIVDMPGHERFVRRMIAGAAGIDAVVMVVAADEGIMPQGREHLGICELLGVQRGIIVVTKTDLADEDLLELVEEDIAGSFEGTFLEGAPLLRFSTRDADNLIGPLRDGLGAFASSVRESQDIAGRHARPFRLPVDRSFSMKGRGTVVTGTAACGEVAIGDVLRVWPGEGTARVREIERHGSSVERFAGAGRLALNLARAAVEEVPVGSVLSPAGALITTNRVDAHIKLLGHVTKPMKSRQRGLLHVGTAHVEAAITQLTGEPLMPGDEAFVQLHLDRPLALAPGERFVVRGSALDPRYGRTIAGGMLLHCLPPRHRLGDQAILDALAALSSSDIAERLDGLLTIAGMRGHSEDELVRFERDGAAAVTKALKSALSRNRVRRFGQGPRYFAPAAVNQLQKRLVSAVGRSHEEHPDRPGIEPDSLIEQVGAWLDDDALRGVIDRLVKSSALARHGTALAMPGFKPTIRTARAEVIEAVIEAIRRCKLATPAPIELVGPGGVSGVGRDELDVAVRTACDSGRLLRIARDYYVAADSLQDAVATLFSRYGDQESFTTGELKEVVGLTRKHLIPLAEYLDGARVTVRDPAGNRRFRTRARQTLEASEPIFGG